MSDKDKKDPKRIASDFKAGETGTAIVVKGDEQKVKTPSQFLNSYFNNFDTIKKYGEYLGRNPDTKVEGHFTSIPEAKRAIDSIESFKGINLPHQEREVIKGIFSLCQKQNVSESRPYVTLKNISQLYEEILEKKRIKEKGGTTYPTYSGAETKAVDEALKKLTTNLCEIVIMGTGEYDKKLKKRSKYFYMYQGALISIEWFGHTFSNTITGEEIKRRGQCKITILPKVLLRNYETQFKLIPKHLIREIKTKCPEIKRIKGTVVLFIDYLHRQDRIGLIDGYIMRRTRTELIKKLSLEEQRKKQGEKYINDLLFECYDIATRTGYICKYELDQPGQREPVDVFYLNIEKFAHLKPKQISAAGAVDERIVPL
jgi:hypothetical protein